MAQATGQDARSTTRYFAPHNLDHGRRPALRQVCTPLGLAGFGLRVVPRFGGSIPMPIGIGTPRLVRLARGIHVSTARGPSPSLGDSGRTLGRRAGRIDHFVLVLVSQNGRDAPAKSNGKSETALIMCGDSTTTVTITWSGKVSLSSKT